MMLPGRRPSWPLTGFRSSVTCRLVGVSTSGFYDWQSPAAVGSGGGRCRAGRPHPAPLHELSRGTYGSPRVTAELRLGLGGREVHHQRVARLMRSARPGWDHRRRRRRGCTRRNPKAVPSDDLVERHSTVDGPDRLWVRRHHPAPHRPGLALRRLRHRRLQPAGCVGWALGDHCRTDLVVDALHMALWRRQSADGCVPPFRPRLPIHVMGVRPTPPSTPACSAPWAPSATASTTVAESFFATLQTELLDRHHGPRASWPKRSSSRSKPSTTRPAGTRPWRCWPPTTTTPTTR